MLMPKKVKFRKQQKGKRRGKAWRGSSLAFGEYGLKVMECGYITDRQIEASRIAMTRFIKRGGKIWLRLFPDKPITKKPAEVRMGSGKGALDHWVAVVRPGKILFEMEGCCPESRRKRCAWRRTSCRCGPSLCSGRVRRRPRRRRRSRLHKQGDRELWQCASRGWKRQRPRENRRWNSKRFAI